MTLSAQERSYTEKVLKAFLFSKTILVFAINIFFTQPITVKKASKVTKINS